MPLLSTDCISCVHVPEAGWKGRKMWTRKSKRDFHSRVLSEHPAIRGTRIEYRQQPLKACWPSQLQTCNFLEISRKHRSWGKGACLNPHWIVLAGYNSSKASLSFISITKNKKGFLRNLLRAPKIVYMRTQGMAPWLREHACIQRMQIPILQQAIHSLL